MRGIYLPDLHQAVIGLGSYEVSDGMRIRIVSTTIMLALIALAIGLMDGTAQEQSGTPAPIASPASSGEIVLVEIEDYEFIPSRVEIEVGDTVRWKNLDTSPHSVISDEEDEPVDSGRMDRGAGFRHRFDSPGTFNYECGYHQNMGGVVIVRPATGDPAAAATPSP